MLRCLVLISPFIILQLERPPLKFQFQSITFVFILVDLLLPILTASVARSDVNQYANTAAAAMQASKLPDPKKLMFHNSSMTRDVVGKKKN